MIVNCKHCRTEINRSPCFIKRVKNVFCSQGCHHAYQKSTRVSCICVTCGGEFKQNPYRAQKAREHYCSKSCSPKAAIRNCEICSKQFKTSNHFVKLGRGRYCSRKCYGLSERGPNNPGWKDDKYSESRKARNSKLSKEWRDTVFTRDEGKCRKCDSGENLRGHHLFSFARYPDLRFEISNGITFCNLCHLEFHTIYGRYNFSPTDTFAFLGYDVGSQQSMILGITDVKQRFNEMGIV